MVAAASLRAWVPRWWRGEGGGVGRVLDGVLLPAEAAYRVAVAARNAAYDRQWLRVEEPPIPVVSVGNLTVGGAGKTPVTAWLARRLADLGRRPAVVLSGYGADEVLLHAEMNPDVPVFASRRRIAAVRTAAGAGARVAVLDDGFQHRALRRTLDVVLVAAESWTEEPRLLPRGPWRDSPRALRRAAVILVTRKSASRARAAEIADRLGERLPEALVSLCHLELASATRLADGEVVDLELAGTRVLAVAALAEPEPFRRQLELAGAQVELLAFPDHHPYGAADASDIAARAAGRPILMTRKDAVKLRPLLPDASACVLEQRVTIEQGDPLERLVLGRLAPEGA